MCRLVHFRENILMQYAMITIENGKPVDKRSDRLFLFIVTAVILTVAVHMASLYTHTELSEMTRAENIAADIRGNMHQAVLLYSLDSDVSAHEHTIERQFTELLSELTSHSFLFTQEDSLRVMDLKELWRESISILAGGEYSLQSLQKISDAVNSSSDELISAIEQRLKTFRNLRFYATLLLILTSLVLTALMLQLRRSIMTRLLNTSITDTLTGLKNRNYMHEYIRDFLGHTGDWKNTPFRAFILCDIDHFRQIHDTYGHQKGDEVLMSVARTLRNLARKDTLLFRYGGDEFLLFLHFATVKEALLYTEAVRHEVQSHGHGDVRLTMSFGISLYTGERDIHRIIGFADSALHAAKEAGRNRTFVKTPSTGVMPARQVIG